MRHRTPLLVDMAARDLGVDLFGRRHRTPLLLSPIGVLSAAHADADLGTARGAREQGVTPVLSTQASVPMEEVAAVDGLWVSNHGGRQVDRSIGALDALPGVVDAVRGAGSGMPVGLDSGIRSGADAFVALALGADAVGIGRPHVYGLALAGAAGVSEVLRNITAELDLTMALTGCRTLADVTRDRLVEAPTRHP